MDTDIGRIHPEAAIQSGAVRGVGPRRQRSSGRAFAEELEHPDQEPSSAEASRPAGPPHDDEVGSRLDVTG